MRCANLMADCTRSLRRACGGKFAWTGLLLLGMAASGGSSAQAGQTRRFAVIAQGRMGAGQQTPTPQERRSSAQLVDVQTPWGAVGGLQVGVLWRAEASTWLRDLRLELDYQGSFRLEMEEIDSNDRAVSKFLRWQRLSAQLGARLSHALGPGRLGLVPSAGYRLRTLFSTVPAAIVNHGRHGAVLQLGVGYGLAKGRIELRAAPQVEMLFADAALRRQAQGDLRVGVGVLGELAVWMYGPWKISARWEQMHAVAGDTAFKSQVATLGLGFDPAGWTK